MQFAGQRTDLDFKPLGEPVNVLVALNDDTLPAPEALMVTGITPQQTVADGYSEAQFAKLLTDEIFTPDTIVVGFNNIRFDDEFIRALLWRNFYDPYEWAWRDGRSRWDMLDVVRITRALRPDGIEWPVDDEGRETNRLELLTKANKIDHFKAHDAMSDVEALIAVTKLIKIKQPQLYEYLLNLRDKKEIAKLVNLDDKKPFVYTSGRYEGEYHKTTVAFPLTSAGNGNVAVYDLRYDPTPFLKMSAKQLADILYANREARQQDDFVALPVKKLAYNKAPAVAPLGVLEQSDGWVRIGLDADIIAKHRDILLSEPAFAENIRSIFEAEKEFARSPDPEANLYDGFLNDKDRLRVSKIPMMGGADLADYQPTFDDERLPELLLHYKARNFPRSLAEDESIKWETWRAEHINKQLPGFLASLQRLSQTVTDDSKQFVLQELQLWAESIVPAD